MCLELAHITRTFFCLENYLDSRVMLHTQLHLHYTYFSGIIPLVRNDVGQQGTQDIIILELYARSK